MGRLDWPETADDQRARRTLWQDARRGQGAVVPPCCRRPAVPLVDVDLHNHSRGVREGGAPAPRPDHRAGPWRRFAASACHPEQNRLGVFLVGGQPQSPRPQSRYIGPLTHMPPTVIDQHRTGVVRGQPAHPAGGTDHRRRPMPEAEPELRSPSAGPHTVRKVPPVRDATQARWTAQRPLDCSARFFQPANPGATPHPTPPGRVAQSGFAASRTRAVPRAPCRPAPGPSTTRGTPRARLAAATRLPRRHSGRRSSCCGSVAALCLATAAADDLRRHDQQRSVHPRPTSRLPAHAAPGPWSAVNALSSGVQHAVKPFVSRTYTCVVRRPSRVLDSDIWLCLTPFVPTPWLPSLVSPSSAKRLRCIRRCQSHARRSAPVRVTGRRDPLPAQIAAALQPLHWSMVASYHCAASASAPDTPSRTIVKPYGHARPLYGCD